MDIFEYISQGGPILKVLIGLNFIGLALIGFKLISFRKEQSLIPHIAKNILNSIMSAPNTPTEENNFLEISKDKVYSFTSSLEKGLNTIKIIATISPLLGLLGTVIGVLSSFQTISQQGLSNPSIFAGGISMALVTTVGGLLVAIPHFISYNYLSNWLNNFEVSLSDRVTNLYLNYTEGTQS